MNKLPKIDICCSTCDLYNEKTKKCKDCDDTRSKSDFCTSFTPKHSEIVKSIFNFIDQTTD